MTVKSEPLRYAFDAPLRSPARAKIIAASISSPMRCHSVACGMASNAIGYAQFISLSWFGTPCVLAIPPLTRLRFAQTREEEAETL